MRRSLCLVRDEEQLHHVIERISESDHFSWDVETIGEYALHPIRNEVAWIALSAPGVDAVIPMRHPIGNKIIGYDKEPRLGKDGKWRNYRVPIWEEPPRQLRPSVVFAALDELFDSDRLKIAHNLAFDALSIAKYRDGRVPAPPYHCTLVSSWLLDENRRNDLKSRVKEVYGSNYDPGKTGKKIATTFFDEVARYVCLDARFTRLLARRNIQEIYANRLDGVWALEMDVLEVVLSMTLTGAPVDEQALIRLKDHLEKLIEQHEAQAYRAAGRQFNLNAPAQVAEVLFSPKSVGGQGLRSSKLTPGGRAKWRAGITPDISDRSTDAETLQKFAGNPVVDALLAYKEAGKLLSTYVMSYLGDPTKKDKPRQLYKGRIHTTFKQYGTVTGRFSSSDPNLQNIPRPSTDLGRRVRGLIVAPPGYVLLTADYSQIELVLLAHFAGPGALYQGFLDGSDPHTVTAAQILRIPSEEVNAEQRNAYGKRINFLIGYGGGANLLAETARIPLKEARHIMAMHQEAFPEIYEYKANLIRTARKRNPPHIRTLTGRMRRIPDLRSSDQYWRGRAERQIVNSHIQGSAADLIKIAMVRTHRLLPPEAKLILTVHDELVTMVPEALVEESVAAVREGMLGEGIQELISVPLKADIKVVNRWSEAK